jgi:endonuclease/exonuclease/phosphatase family metal-dependent hydrolase
MKILFKALTFTYLILSIVLFLLACISPFFSPVENALIYYAGLAYPILAVNMIFVILGLMISFKKWWAIVFLLPLVWFGIDHLSVFQLSKEASNGNGIKIVTFNTFFQKTIKENAGELARWKKFMSNKHTQADILCLQEFKGQFSNMIEDPADYHLFPEGSSYLKIASRFPIKDGGHIKNEADRILAIWVDLEIKEKPVRVYNLHLSSNSVSVLLAKPEKKEGSVDTERLVEEGKWMYRQILEKAQIRNDEARVIKEHMAVAPHPIILCGDFNETPQTNTYRLLKGELKDTFRGSEFGIHSTYEGNPKGIRIDYICVPAEWNLIDHHIIPYHLSDHKAVFAKVGLP